MGYSSNSIEGWKDVEVKISLLLIPLALGTCKPISSKQIKIILKVFAYTISLALVILTIIAFVKYSRDGDSSHFFYNHFATFDRVPIHYFALYVNLAFFIVFKMMVNGLQNKSGRFIILHIALLILLMTALFLCSVRIQFIAFVISFIVFLIWHFRKILRPHQLILAGLGFILLLFSVAWIIPESRRRIVETMDEYSAYKGREELKQMNHRVFLWKYGWKVIQKNFWVGTGSGSANDELHEYLKEEKAKFWNGYGTYTLGEKQYNLHNAFLQHFATYGIIGFLLLLGIYLFSLFNLPPNLPYIGAVFLLLTFISFNTESMLERQAGNLFFALFYGLLFVNPKRIITPKEKV